MEPRFYQGNRPTIGQLKNTRLPLSGPEKQINERFTPGDSRHLFRLGFFFAELGATG